MPSRNLLLLPHYPKNRPEAAPRVSNGSAWRLAAGSGDYCGAESPSLGFVGLGSARGGIGSGARATGMPFRLVVRGMFPETSSRTAGPVDEGHHAAPAVIGHLVPQGAGAIANQPFCLLSAHAPHPHIRLCARSLASANYK